MALVNSGRGRRVCPAPAAPRHLRRRPALEQLPEPGHHVQRLPRPCLQGRYDADVSRGLSTVDGAPGAGSGSWPPTQARTRHQSSSQPDRSANSTGTPIEATVRPPCRARPLRRTRPTAGRRSTRTPQRVTATSSATAQRPDHCSSGSGVRRTRSAADQPDHRCADPALKRPPVPFLRIVNHQRRPGVPVGGSAIRGVVPESPPRARMVPVTAPLSGISFEDAAAT
jgi:hypothetical protein